VKYLTVQEVSCSDPAAFGVRLDPGAGCWSCANSPPGGPGRGWSRADRVVWDRLV